MPLNLLSWRYVTRGRPAAISGIVREVSAAALPAVGIALALLSVASGAGVALALESIALDAVVYFLDPAAIWPLARVGLASGVAAVVCLLLGRRLRA